MKTKSISYIFSYNRQIKPKHACKTQNTSAKRNAKRKTQARSAKRKTVSFSASVKAQDGVLLSFRTIPRLRTFTASARRGQFPRTLIGIVLGDIGCTSGCSCTPRSVLAATRASCIGNHSGIFACVLPFAFGFALCVFLFMVIKPTFRTTIVSFIATWECFKELGEGKP